MTDKELRKLSRADLLEMLLMQSKEVERLRSELDEANRKLENRKILLENSGSIAEAALKINEVFEAAQLAADQYLENIKQIAEYPTERNNYDFEDEESES
ncbi:MAG: DNA repair protein [Acutalibacteraceae bacterium]|nr:DNA repair protein [Acutalibacteraceae bacterium]